MNFLKNFSGWCFFFVLLAGIFPTSAQIFVRPNGGNNAFNGRSWNNAKATLPAALNVASVGDTVFVTAGVYRVDNLTIPAGVSLVGGLPNNLTGTNVTPRFYLNDHATWDDDTLATILDGRIKKRVATVRGTLENCVLRNGYVMGNGAGAYVDGGTVRRCVLISNKADGEAGDTTMGNGGGAYLTNGGKLINCVLSYNRAKQGMAVAGNDGDLINNTITHNDAPVSCGEFTDYEGNSYPTVLIGEQCWMAENLRTRYYPDGAQIQESYLKFPGNSAANVAEYGLLYSGYVYHSSGRTNGPCPAGWHMPSKNEIETLEMTVFSQLRGQHSDVEDMYGMALASTTGWMSYAGYGNVGYSPAWNNLTGFNGKPAGYNGEELGRFCNLWTNTYKSTANGSPVYYMGMMYWSYNRFSCTAEYRGHTGSTYYWSYVRDYNSIRCLRD